jgi:hypothetical protein
VKNLALIGLAALPLVLAPGGVAQSATPPDIVMDFYRDRQLQGPYTYEELETYLADPTMLQFNPPELSYQLDNEVRRVLGAWRTNRDMGWDEVIEKADGAAPTSRPDSFLKKGNFPFTNREIALALVAGIGLVGGGIAIRRTGR